MTKQQTQDVITELQSRLAYLEGRVATLEQRRYYMYPVMPYLEAPYRAPTYPYWGDTTAPQSIGSGTVTVT